MHRDACEVRDFALIPVWDIDRFGRFDSIDMGEWVAPLRRAGVSLESVNRGCIDWDDSAPKVTAMKRERQQVQEKLQQAENASTNQDIQSVAKVAAAKLWTLGEDLDQAPPALSENYSSGLCPVWSSASTRCRRGSG